MNDKLRYPARLNWLRLGLPILAGLLVVVATLALMSQVTAPVHADPIDPPAGYPKLKLSLKTVTPTLAGSGGATLSYVIEIRNTGAYTAAGATLTDTIPANTTYNGDAAASAGPPPTVSSGRLTWAGDVGFDQTVVLSFSVDVAPTYSGTVRNTAVISHPLIAAAVVVSADSVVTDQPILTVQKSAVPLIPGPNKAMTYTLVVTNQGQPAVNLPVTVTDKLPANTTFNGAGPDGTYSAVDNEVTWTRNISLDLGETSEFYFSVDVTNVPSGTVIANSNYQVAGPPGSLTAGDPYTITVLDPILMLSKETRPDPSGSNREATYVLTLLNLGSRATNLLITDTVPAGSTYVTGGTESGGVVSWNWPVLDTFESAQFTYTVYISDVANVSLVNDEYGVCSGEGVCRPGDVLTSVVGPPTFVPFALVDPIAHKPGGGTGTEVTPTLGIRNIGPGNALSATAILFFERLSVSASDLVIITDTGAPVPSPLPDGPACGSKCVSYVWRGDLGNGETITFTTGTGQSTIGGAEGTPYTATIVITDTLSGFTTDPATADAVGLVTHRSNLIPTKSAPPVIGPGQLMTYSINVRNSALSTDDPPFPWLTDTVPLSVTVVNISDGGVSTTMGSAVVISWTLPPMSTGGQLNRAYSVRVDGDLVSGTQIINDDYRASWYELGDGAVFSNTGRPVTTTVREVGLIDSYKVVSPALVSPGPGNVLTYHVHVVNSSATPLSGVTVYDWLPWESSTYQRDAVVSAGSILSDIVSVAWTGDVGAFSEEVITMTVLVDADFTGAITNTAVISHPTLREDVVVDAVTYVTDNPVLRIRKSASPDPVAAGAALEYTIEVMNLGQDATGLVVTDSIPVNTTYVPGSATAGGQVTAGQVRWQSPLLEAGATRTFTFRVTVSGAGDSVVNDRYGVSAAGGFVASGPAVVTQIKERKVYLPVIVRQ